MIRFGIPTHQAFYFILLEGNGSFYKKALEGLKTWNVLSGNLEKVRQ